MERKNNIENQMQALKHHFPFLSDDVLYALLMMGIHLLGNKIPFMVVGSIAWKALGLPLNREIKDIDIEIVCDDEEKLLLFENICKEQGSKLHLDEENDITHFEHKPYMFYAFGIEFNIWVSKKTFFHKKSVSCGGILIPTVDEVVGIKAQYHRPKDLEDLLGLSKALMSMICGEENLDKFMDKINISEIEKIILKDESDTGEK